MLIIRSILILTIVLNLSMAQISGQDSVSIPKFSPLRRSFYDINDWNRQGHTSFDLRFQENVPQPLQFYTQPQMPVNQWEIDTRNSSYYTPRIVRDELNLIMNRPRETAFVPVLGAAYIAYQLAANYLIIKSKLVISATDILSCQEELPVLNELWHENPQTCSQLLQKPVLKPKYTYTELRSALARLADRNLVKIKQIENDESQYFPGISEKETRELLQAARSDTTLTPDQADQIGPLLIKYQGPPK